MNFNKFEIFLKPYHTNIKHYLTYLILVAILLLLIFSFFYFQFVWILVIILVWKFWGEIYQIILVQFMNRKILLVETFLVNANLKRSFFPVLNIEKPKMAFRKYIKKTKIHKSKFLAIYPLRDIENNNDNLLSEFYTLFSFVMSFDRTQNILSFFFVGFIAFNFLYSLTILSIFEFINQYKSLSFSKYILTLTNVTYIKILLMIIIFGLFIGSCII